MKLFYRVSPEQYRRMLDRVREEFGMHEETDEEKTLLLLDDPSRIELVSASYDPVEDGTVHIRVVLNDESLREFFDSVFGEPYRVR